MNCVRLAQKANNLILEIMMIMIIAIIIIIIITKAVARNTHLLLFSFFLFSVPLLHTRTLQEKNQSAREKHLRREMNHTQVANS